MKYHRLTDSQFNEMYHEFALYLASNSIDKRKWDKIKKSKKHTVDFFLDNFSDLVWEKILTQCSYMEFVTNHQLFLFNTRLDEVESLVVKVTGTVCDLSSIEGFKWMVNNMQTDAVTLFQATKSYVPTRNEFIYSYLRTGAVLSEGSHFKELKSYF